MICDQTPSNSLYFWPQGVRGYKVIHVYIIIGDSRVVHGVCSTSVQPTHFPSLILYIGVPFSCNGIASLGNMQISNSRLCESSKCWVFSAVNHPWWRSMLFHRRGLLWLGSAARYIWWQRWDNDNCQIGVALPM